MRRLVVGIALAALFRCAATPAPAPLPEPAPPAPAAPTEPAPVGNVRVTTATLNVRKEPATTAEVLAQVKRNDRLALLATRGDWSNVRLADGTTGWVSSKLVSSDAPSSATARRRGNCLPDSEFRFTQPPVPSFSDTQTAHGVVTVDANVDAHGVVTSTRVVSNTTGDSSLATLAEKEIRNARFAPPVRNCEPKAFIFAYKRSF
jgi:TonB family protein